MGKFYHIEPRLKSIISGKLESPILFFMFEEPHAPIKKFDLHSHEFTEIFYITGGKGIMHYENGSHLLSPGDVVVINKEVLHVEHSLENDNRLTYFTLTIDESFPFNSSGTEKVEKLHFSTLDKPFIKNALEAIHDELVNKSEYYEVTVRALLTYLEIEFARIAQVKPLVVEKDQSTIYDIPSVRDYITNNYALDVRLKDLAKMAYMSEVHLINSFKKAYGISPIQFLINERIKNAKFLLRNTIDSITNIALAVGYNDPVYFSKIFHKNTGQTPSKYRQLIKCSPPTPEQYTYED